MTPKERALWVTTMNLEQAIYLMKTAPIERDKEMFEEQRDMYQYLLDLIKGDKDHDTP